MDRYLPPEKAEAAENGKSSSSKTKSTDNSVKGPSPLKPLRDLNLDGKFKAGLIKVANAKLTDLKVGVKAKEGIINVTPLSANLYKGHFAGNAKMDARRDSPLLSVSYDLKNLQAGPLLQDVAGVDRISGAARSSAKITARGLEPSDLKKSLNGTANFMFEDGALKGINVGRLIRNAYNIFKGLPPEPGGVCR